MKKPVRKSAAASAMKKPAGNPNPAVDAVFGAYPKPVKAKLLALRRLIFDTADTTEGVGALEEALKWGQPSYLTAESRSGIEDQPAQRPELRSDRIGIGVEDRIDCGRWRVRALPAWGSCCLRCFRHRNLPVLSAEQTSAESAKVHR